LLEAHADDRHSVTALFVEANRALHQSGDARDLIGGARLPDALAVLSGGLHAVHHHREADAVDPRFLPDQGPHGLADLVVGGFLLPRFLRAGALVAGIRVRQVVLHGDGAGLFLGLAGGIDALRAARHLAVRIVAF